MLRFKGAILRSTVELSELRLQFLSAEILGIIGIVTIPQCHGFDLHFVL